MLRVSVGLVFLLLITACSDPRPGVTDPPVTVPPIVPPITPTDTPAPAVPREMRGLWIATVGNIDWPSRSGLSADQQRAELIDLLTRAAATGLNAILFQVRPAADAVYDSPLEPWAALLSGTQGQSPGYDPLAFAIQEAHARGLELHAWINPFRAGNTADTARLAASHVFRTRPDLVRVYGRNIWLDPGEPDVHERSIAALRDIVNRYDIDGIVADDYFYPYVENDASGRAIAFPDDATFARYGAGRPRDDWRRENVNRFVERMYREVHALKPTVKVGMSPFGIWRPGNPPGIIGLDAYASIYADSRKWLQQGWVDYFAPQLYWAITPPQQSYPALLDWWIAQNIMGRHIWPALAVYKSNSGQAGAFTMQEIPDQIRLTRTRPAGTGHILYNTTWTFKRNSGLTATTLAAELYQSRALVPASPWLDATPPGTPALRVDGNIIELSVAPGEPVRWWAVRQRTAGAWSTHVLFGNARSMTVAPAVDRVLVQAVDQAGNASAAASWQR